MGSRRPRLLILAMDLGTSSVRTALFDESGTRIDETTADAAHAPHYSPDGGAELSPAIVLRGAAGCLRKTLRAHARLTPGSRVPIAAVCASGFWHSVLGVGKNGRPGTPIYTWADTRCASDAARLREQFSETVVHARTGCMLRSSFWPAKLRWLRRTQPRLFARVSRWLSPTDWIFEQLFGARGCSDSMASGTGLYDLRKADWDSQLFEACGVTREQLPAISATSDAGLRMPNALREARIFAPIGDGAASNLGCGADQPGFFAVNIGTSAAVRTIELNDTKTRSAAEIPFGLFRYVVDGKRRILGGAVSNAGNLRTWCFSRLRLPQNVQQAERALARRRTDQEDLTVLPFWVGERAPSWPEELSGTIVGLNQSTNATDILRATTASVYCRLGQILELLETAAGRADTVIVSGGVVHSAACVRLLADCLGRDLRLSTEPEASLRGAAVYGLEQVGCRPVALRPGRKVRHDPQLAKQHRLRQRRQIALEELLRSGAAI